MQGASKIDTVDAETRRQKKSGRRERDYQGERGKLPPRRNIHKLITRGIRSDGSLLLRRLPLHHKLEHEIPLRRLLRAARGSAKSATLSITAEVILTTAGGAK